MKKFVIIFLILGIVLVLIAFILAMIKASNINIIGGANRSTFYTVLRCSHNRLYFYLAISGVLSIIASAVMAVITAIKK